MTRNQATTRTTAPQARSRMGQADPLADLRMQVLRAARRRCDELGDGPDAREAMKRDVLATPPELLADLGVALAAPIDRALLLASAAPIPTTTPKE